VVTRFIAGGIDLVLVLLMMGFADLFVAGTAFLLHPRTFHWPAHLGWSIPAVGFVVAAPYLTVCWASVGRTYGDALLGLRVVNARGVQPSVAGAFVRAVLCIAFPVGLLWVAISPLNRSLQDLLLRTSVIHDWNPRSDGVRMPVPGDHPL
jgi:uncharacterized RDD family membrane protein YckC